MNDKVGTPATVEVRAFGVLKQVFDQRNWEFPCFFPLDKGCSGLELAQNMQLPLDKIEAVFINGIAFPLAEGQIKPGDRVGFIPVGVPGPYRVMLGFVKLPKSEDAAKD